MSNTPLNEAERHWAHAEYLAENERLRLGLLYLTSNIYAMKDGEDGQADPDVRTADNLAREAWLKRLRAAAMDVAIVVPIITEPRERTPHPEACGS